WISAPTRRRRLSSMANRYLAPNPPMFSLTPWMTPWPRLKTRPGDKYGNQPADIISGRCPCPAKPVRGATVAGLFCFGHRPAHALGVTRRCFLPGTGDHPGTTGLGLGAVGNLLTQYRNALIIVTSVILMLLGLAQAAGFGFDLSKAFPGAGSLQ